MKNIYFDNAATTPLLPEVLEIIRKTLVNNYGNPSSIHKDGIAARSIIEENRRIISTSLNCSTSNIIFTASGTEASNLFFYNAIFKLGVKRIITSSIEHPCVLNTAKFYAERYNVQLDFVKLSIDYTYDLNHLDELLKFNDSLCLVSLMHVNNEIGLSNDIIALSKLVKTHNAYLHIDTVQSIGFSNIDTSALDVDFLNASAHKFYGPKGIGFAYLKEPGLIESQIFGGGQERNIRSGTENIGGIAGIGSALQYMEQNRSEINNHLRSINEYFRSELNKLPLKIEPIITDYNLSSPKILTVVFPHFKGSDLLVANLDIHGISASGGSACSSGTEKASHVLQFIKPNEKGKIIRFSFSIFNTIEEVDICINVLRTIFKKI